MQRSPKGLAALEMKVACRQCDKQMPVAYGCRNRSRSDKGESDSKWNPRLNRKIHGMYQRKPHAGRKYGKWNLIT
jgi:hypothetical protein